uniref:KH domain-containing protein n=1 Tax=Caenorhabditis tropicalis TaxID=1561998 RepID=A0A1I7UI44_9PELO
MNRDGIYIELDSDTDSRFYTSNYGIFNQEPVRRDTDWRRYQRPLKMADAQRPTEMDRIVERIMDHNPFFDVYETVPTISSRPPINGIFHDEAEIRHFERMAELERLYKEYNDELLERERREIEIKEQRIRDQQRIVDAQKLEMIERQERIKRYEPYRRHLEVRRAESERTPRSQWSEVMPRRTSEDRRSSDRSPRSSEDEGSPRRTFGERSPRHSGFFEEDPSPRRRRSSGEHRQRKLERKVPKKHRYNTPEENAKLEAYIPTRNYSYMTAEEHKAMAAEQRKTQKYQISEHGLRSYKRIANETRFSCRISVDKDHRQMIYRYLILRSDDPKNIEKCRKELDEAIMENLMEEYVHDGKQLDVVYPFTQKTRHAFTRLGDTVVDRIMDVHSVEMRDCRRDSIYGDPLPPLLLTGSPENILKVKKRLDKELEEPDNSMTKEIAVPSKVFDHFFQSTRCHVERIAKKTNTVIEILEATKNLKIRGSPFGIRKAQEQVDNLEKRAHQLPDDSDEAVYHQTINPEDVRKIVGIRGEVINGFRKRTGAKCFLEEGEDRRNNLMIFSGTIEQAKAAYQAVHAHLHQGIILDGGYIENHSKMARQRSDAIRERYQRNLGKFLPPQ